MGVKINKKLIGVRIMQRRKTAGLTQNVARIFLQRSLSCKCAAFWVKRQITTCLEKSERTPMKLHDW